MSHPVGFAFANAISRAKKNKTDMTVRQQCLVQGFRLLTEKHRAAVLNMVLAIPAAG
jgi:hypothetical protein